MVKNGRLKGARFFLAAPALLILVQIVDNHLHHKSLLARDAGEGG
jgi:hypothetical protein